MPEGEPTTDAPQDVGGDTAGGLLTGGRRVYLDGSAGMAGDMLLATLLDLGASLPAVRAGLAALELEEAWSLETEVVHRAGIRSLRAVVRVAGEDADAAFVDESVAKPGPSDTGRGGSDLRATAHDSRHGHDRDHPHGQGDTHEGHDRPVPSRAYADIRALLEGSPLPERVMRRALATFARLAEAEAGVHGVDVDAVHFHEVGSTDAIIDIVGCCLALEDLGVDELFCTPLHVGRGHVRTAHGMLPVPAPATLALLRDVPIYQTSVRGELTTPTGAALVRALCSSVGPLPEVRVRRIGHGAGSKEFPFANVVRSLLVVDAGDAGDGTRETVVELACNLDDMTPEQLATVVDPLLRLGALDVWIEHVLMKKGRPAFVLHVLAAPADAPRLETAMFERTTTLGVRSLRMERTALERTVRTTVVAGRPVAVKIGLLGGRAITVAAEFEDAARVASELGRNVRDVMVQAERTVRDDLEEAS